MARGITENDVHTAADALVADGERPTVERIRAYLGTGSPNTVVRWLDTWWKALGTRLQAHESRLNTPEAPEAVVTLAGKWWAVALEHAKGAAEEALASEREAIEAAKVALQGEREGFEEEAAALRLREAAALSARDVASARSDELQRLVASLEGQLEELTAHRDAADARVAASESRYKELENQHHVLQGQALSERDSLTRHVQATEDRAHAEVDRSRQESREFKEQLAVLKQARATEQAASRNRMDELRHEVTEALREAAIQRAKAEALEGQLLQLRDLPAALESVLQQAQSQSKSRAAAKRSVRAPSKRKKGEASARKTSAADLD